MIRIPVINLTGGILIKRPSFREDDGDDERVTGKDFCEELGLGVVNGLRDRLRGASGERICLENRLEDSPLQRQFYYLWVTSGWAPSAPCACAFFRFSDEPNRPFY